MSEFRILKRTYGSGKETFVVQVCETIHWEAVKEYDRANDAEGDVALRKSNSVIKQEIYNGA